MSKYRNIRITEQQDEKCQQGESCLKYLVILFIAIAYLTRNTDSNDSASIFIPRLQIAAVGNQPYTDTKHHDCDAAVVLCLFNYPVF